jgi:methylated-DNA-[protein]-cysteine S-methyltransferase
MAGHILFQTAIGHCGIAWSDKGIVRTALPADDIATTLHALNRQEMSVCCTTPPEVVSTIERISSLLAGGADNLQSVALDWRGVPDFEARVYAATRMIGPGQTSTYGAIARALGDATLARAVGQALGRNPWPIIVPCHRVLAAGGKSGGFSAPGGVSTKRRMLAIESVHCPREGDLFGP